MWLLVIAAALLSAPADFDAWFTGATLRVDFDHVGSAGHEHLALDRVHVEGPWPGSRTQLIDPTNLGVYLVEVADLATHQVLYSRGFASIFGEWVTTAEARQGLWRSFAEGVRVPEPRAPIQLRIRRRRADQAFEEVWQIVIDPASRFVDRAAVAPRPVRAVQDNGDPATHVDLLFLGDGYTAAEMGRFHADVDRLTAALFAVEPYRSRRAQFNVRAVETPAAESGITRPRAATFRNSPLAARYNTFDSERYVLTLEDRAWRDAAAAAPYDTVIILVNDRQYGGGGIFNLYATASTGSAFAEYLVVHEFGHSFAGLGDEYYTSDVAYEPFAGTRTEPWEPNITALGDPATLKWRDLIGADTPLPTPWDKPGYEARAAEYRKQRHDLRASGAGEDAIEQLFFAERTEMTARLGGEPFARRVGAFEGAMYEATGLYRPTTDCIMYTRDEVGFCPVCRRAIERVIDLHVR